MATKQLEKAIFKPLSPDKTKAGEANSDESTWLTVNFNPKELSLQRTVESAPAQNTGPAAQLQLKGARNFTLEMTLYFDTFELGTSVRDEYMRKLESFTYPAKNGDQPPSGGAQGSGAAAPGGAGQSTAASGQEKQNPSVLFVWGNFRFCGMVESLSQRYTMFLSNGTPVRAEATITLRQTILTDKDNSLDVKESPPSPTQTADETRNKGAAPLNQLNNPSSQYDDPLALVDSANAADKTDAAAAADAAARNPAAGLAKPGAQDKGGIGSTIGSAAKKAGAAGRSGASKVLHSLAAGNSSSMNASSIVNGRATMNNASPVGGAVGMLIQEGIAALFGTHKSTVTVTTPPTTPSTPPTTPPGGGPTRGGNG